MTIRALTITMFLVCTIASSQAQIRDTILLNFEQNQQLLIILNHASHLRELTGINESVEHINLALQKFREEVDPAIPAKVYYQQLEGTPNPIRIEQTVGSHLAAYIDDQGKLIKGKSTADSIFIQLPPLDTLEPKSKFVKLVLIVDYLEDVEMLTSIDIDQQLQSIYLKNDQYQSGGLLKNTPSQIIYAYDPAEGVKYISHKHEAKDFLRIGGPIGLNLVKGEWGLDFGLSAAFIFGDRYLDTRWKLSFSYNWLTFYQDNQEGEKEIQTNTFVNGYTKYYFSENTAIGVGLGYLLEREGNIFEDNTYNIFIPIDLGKSGFSLQTNLYFNDGFENLFPALRVGISL